MSDIPFEAAQPHPSLTKARLFWRPALAFAVAGAAAVGLMIPAGATDAELAMLLRFMAVIKAAMAVGTAALIGWRLAWPVRTAVASGYVVAVAAMACGSGLIWQLGHVGAGAALVHGGLAMVAGVAWLDRAGWEPAVGTLVNSSRRGQHGFASQARQQNTVAPSGPLL